MRVIHAELEKTGFKYFVIIEENKAVSGIFQRCSWFVITHKVQFWYIAGKRDCSNKGFNNNDNDNVQHNSGIVSWGLCCIWMVCTFAQQMEMKNDRERVSYSTHKEMSRRGKKWQHNTNLTVSEVQTASCMTGEIWCTKWGHAEVRRCTRTCNVTTLSKTWTSCRYFEQTEIKTTIIRVIGTSIIL